MGREKSGSAPKRTVSSAAAPARRKKAPPPPDVSRGAGRAVIGIIIGVVAIICLGAVITGYMVTDGEKIYPNVVVAGVEIGGDTASEAAAKLDAAGFGRQGDEAVTIKLPLDHRLVIMGRDVGIVTSSAQAAAKAYGFGRDGNIFKNLLTYISCIGKETQLDVDSAFSLDEEYVRTLVEDAVKKVNAALLGAETRVDDEYVIFVKGASSITADAEEVMTLVREAFAGRRFDEAVEYLPAARGAEEEIDFQSLLDSIYTAPKSAEYITETGEITEHENGLSFDVEEARLAWSQAQSGEEVAIPLITTEPEVTSTYLRSVIFADLLGEKSTSLSGSSSSRINNITLAAAAINGLVLNPGDEFSYNGVVGQRTTAKGYQAAGAYNNGQVVSEVGGGICQVSSTLYYVSLLANLEITDRLCHMFAVGYLPPGLDATVSWPGPDFKFRNDRDYPIKIEAYTDMTQYTVTIKIYGTDVDGSYVMLTNETWGTANGTGAAVYRWLYDRDGNLIVKTEERRSQYSYHRESGDEPPPEPSEEVPDETTPPDGTTPPDETNPPDETTSPDETTPPDVTAPPDETPTTPVDPVEPPPVVEPPVVEPPAPEPPAEAPTE